MMLGDEINAQRYWKVKGEVKQGKFNRLPKKIKEKRGIILN
jgi:hypothetical protein